jgi:hypothetical protein
MKPVRISPHALTNLTDREIDRAEVERALAEPEAVEQGHAERKIYMRRYHDAVLDQEMLLRVIVEETETELVIITVYKASRIDRYLKGE